MRSLDPGCYVISLTPFDDHERLDESAFRAHLQRMARAGIGVFVGGAGSGEAYTLAADEMRRVLTIAVEELKGKVPVRAMGVEPRTQSEMIRYGALCAEVGVDAMQVYSLDVGHLGKPSDREIERYLDDVLSNITVPAVISTHFSVGYLVPVPLMATLCERYSNVIGINCTSTDQHYLTQLCGAVDERVEIYTGLMTQALAAWSVGASGFLASEGNLVPGMCMEVVRNYKAGELAATVESYGRLLRLSQALLADGGGMRNTKAALALADLPGGMVRRPRLPLTDEGVRARLATMVAEFGIGADS